jgi:uncharacterized protein YdeI (YjbR/CyaY-like superfamily)
MAPVVPKPERIREFRTQSMFEKWLRANHDKEDEIWLKIHKKGSGLRSVTVAEALDVALCWGWIDGLRKSFDDKSFLQRYTPRRPKSIWSQINREHIERLTADGRMTPHGQKQVDAARADGRWEAAYGGRSSMEFPADLLAAINAEPKALKMLAKLNSTNRYALAFRTNNMKTPAGRARKIRTFVDMLKRGEAPYPNAGAGKKPGKT